MPQIQVPHNAVLSAMAETSQWAADEAWLTSLAAGAVLDTAQESAQAAKRSTQQVAVIPIMGGISHRATWWAGTTTTGVSQQLDAALQSKQIGGIVLYVDSPGGSSTGLEELGQHIAEAAMIKPVVAYTEGLNASAAYWLSSQATQLWASPSSRIGSVGVYQMHVDQSKMLEEMGVQVTFIKAGDFKTEGNGFQPLTKEAKAYLQSQVDDTYLQFVEAVARGRRTTQENVMETYGQGRVVKARKAQALGMIDQVGSFADVLQSLGMAVSKRPVSELNRRKAQAVAQLALSASL